MPDIITVGTISAPVLSYKPHSHEQWELIYYTSGSGTLTIENINYSFESGNIFLVPPNNIHTDSSVAGFTNFYMYLTNLAIPKVPVKVEDISTRDIYNLLLMIQREYYQRVESHKPIIDSLLNSILTYIDTLNKSHRQNNNVEAIRQIITENFSNPNFSVSNAYEQLYINSDYARRLFLKETGTTPSNMLRQLRIRKAKELLETSDKKFSIYEIAQQCGFKDQYYFSKAFKQTTGVSPNVWKKCHIQGF